jgi:polysaccharide biosynthesis/export protein
MRSLGLGAIVCCLFLFGVLPARGQAAGDRSDYHIGPKDLLQIGVYEVPELNVRQRVSENGTISLPVIGEIKVAGYTQSQLAAELKRLLEKNYVERATVTVELVELRSRPISVLGAVTKPGDLGFSGQWTLLEAIAAAGGLAEHHGEGIHVLRRADNGLTDQITISADDLLAQADPKVNIPLYSGDLITVERQVPANVYFLGEVATPGALQFSSAEKLTLLAAIARAGGLTDRASTKIVIRRRNGSGELAETTVNYKRILAGDEPDPRLADGDIIVVKESFF